MTAEKSLIGRATRIINKLVQGPDGSSTEERTHLNRAEERELIAVAWRFLAVQGYEWATVMTIREEMVDLAGDEYIIPSSMSVARYLTEAKGPLSDVVEASEGKTGPFGRYRKWRLTNDDGPTTHQEFESQ